MYILILKLVEIFQQLGIKRHKDTKKNDQLKKKTVSLRKNHIKMTQIVLKEGIDNMQMSVLMGLFDSWNVRAEVTAEKKVESKSFSQRFTKTRGMWKDYDIDAKQLRRDAWGTEKLTPQ